MTTTLKSFEKYYYLVFVFLLITSCKKTPSERQNQILEKDAMLVSHTYTFKEIIPSYAKEIIEWQEYFVLEDFLEQLKNTTPKEGLDNALELKTLTKKAKDSLPIGPLKTPSFKARINVFQNEVLKLVDLTYLSTKSAKNTKQQMATIFQTFSNMNLKINAIYDKQKINNTVKIDSVFKKMR